MASKEQIAAKFADLVAKLDIAVVETAAMLCASDAATKNRNDALAAIRERAAWIGQLTKIEETLTVAAATVAKWKSRALELQAADVADVEVALAEAEISAEGAMTWSQITKRKVKPVSRRQIAIGDTGGVLAVVVSNLFQATQLGELYYVEPTDQFALRLNIGAATNVVLTGNVGEIIESTRPAFRVLPCIHGADCTDRAHCQYYHDPFCCGGSERRNWVSSSWQYIGPHKTTPHRRHIGSLSTLDRDVSLVPRTEFDRLKSQIMHDILTLSILQRAFAARDMAKK